MTFEKVYCLYCLPLKPERLEPSFGAIVGRLAKGLVTSIFNPPYDKTRVCSILWKQILSGFI
uniref:Uncharacterized protein n=1 Tax=Setaria italica TaxID=4555 RepID=K4A484_SETIT